MEIQHFNYITIAQTYETTVRDPATKAVPVYKSIYKNTKCY